MKFPQTVTHRKAEVTIYGKSGSYPFYRIVFRANGKRCMKSFATYGEAKEEAEKKVREISQGSQILALSNKEVTSSLAIRDALESYRRDTGRTVSALTAVTEYLEAAKVLGERQLREAVEGFLQTVAVVRRKPLADAVSEFTASRAPKAIGKEGKRSALNPKYVENTANWLRDFSATFPGHGVGDISKIHLNAFIAEYDDLSAKSRNDRRAVVKQFLRWCVRQDYLSASHRLFEADGLITEASDAAPIDYYRPNELRALLEAATIEMRPVIALQAFAGLRLQEALRLDWKDVFGAPGYVSITSGASKTRQRRLVTICESLEKWLGPYRGIEGRVANQWQTLNGYVGAFIELRKSLGIPARRNGMRHAFVSYFYALNQNENLTAAVAGNSAQMVHQHYKALTTIEEAADWFAVVPAKADNVTALGPVE